jgi:hypothetical protein
MDQDAETDEDDGPETAFSQKVGCQTYADLLLIKLTK